MASSRLWTYLVGLLLSYCTVTTLSLPFTRGGEQGEFFEGDILVPKDDSNRHERDTMMIQDMPMEVGSGFGDTMSVDKIAGNLWPGGIVYFKYDSNLDDYLRSFFGEAMAAWEADTCIKFLPADDTQTSYLNYTDQLGCSSYVGRMAGAMQEVSINRDCDRMGNAAHEIGHALGFFHEHTKWNRDEYIRIIWENMDLKYENNFKQYPHNSATRDTEYDFQSIMHYPLDAFTKERGLKTIVVKPDVVLPDCIKKIGQRGSISYKDLVKINKMYNCHAELEKLEVTGDSCSLEPTVVTTTETPPTTPAPEPTKPHCKKSISKDDVISLSIADNNFNDNVICSTTDCVRKDCRDWRSDCYDKKTFRIYMTKNRINPVIKSGYKVVLRDTYRNKFLDCSRQDGCKLTDCSETPIGKDITNYTNQLCPVHHLELYAHKKADNKRVLTTDLFFIKAVNEDKYLSCNGKSCKLVKIADDSTDCLNSDESSGSSSGMECTMTYFRINREECQ